MQIDVYKRVCINDFVLRLRTIAMKSFQLVKRQFIIIVMSSLSVVVVNKMLPVLLLYGLDL